MIPCKKLVIHENIYQRRNAMKPKRRNHHPPIQIISKSHHSMHSNKVNATWLLFQKTNSPYLCMRYINKPKNMPQKYKSLIHHSNENKFVNNQKKYLPHLNEVKMQLIRMHCVDVHKILNHITFSDVIGSTKRNGQYKARSEEKTTMTRYPSIHPWSGKSQMHHINELPMSVQTENYFRIQWKWNKVKKRREERKWEKCNL